MADKTPRSLIRGLTSGAAPSLRSTRSATKQKATKPRKPASSAKKTPNASARKRKRDAPAAAVKDTPRTTIRGFLGGAKKAAVKPASVKKAGRAEKNTPRTMLRGFLANKTPQARPAEPSPSPAAVLTPDSLPSGLTPGSLLGSLNTSVDTSVLPSPGTLPRGAARTVQSFGKLMGSWNPTQDDLLMTLHHRHTKNKSSDWRLIRANFNQQHDGGRSIDALKARYQNVIKANEGFAKPAPKSKRTKGKPAGVKPVTPIPSALINGLFGSFVSTPVAPAAKAAIKQCLADFFPSMIEDLEAYAAHAGRLTIEPGDVMLLMERQRLTLGENSPSAMDLARQHLPMETLEGLLPVALANNEVIPATKKRRTQARRAKTDGT